MAGAWRLHPNPPSFKHGHAPCPSRRCPATAAPGTEAAEVAVPVDGQDRAVRRAYDLYPFVAGQIDAASLKVAHLPLSDGVDRGPADVGDPSVLQGRPNGSFRDPPCIHPLRGVHGQPGSRLRAAPSSCRFVHPMAPPDRRQAHSCPPSPSDKAKGVPSSSSQSQNYYNYLIILYFFIAWIIPPSREPEISWSHPVCTGRNLPRIGAFLHTSRIQIRSVRSETSQS